MGNMNFFTVRWAILAKGEFSRTRGMGSLNVICDMQVNYALVSTFIDKYKSVSDK
jgi:hypothetical protein